ncbi:uncharacterized protein cubi_01356 [Cryptosporidium ubiquitum]|uniref:ISP1 C-terminal domain-containing protein n=1 Tax=Cryptosporidium ubiquitum TaxID=857276 RepID=A0A1J4MDG6_9CRYT|nr:uncharacterized protein cubi_01356 [Cryptosporidium ubiquitum]OII72023.1 hypothetical protein cubi_01356 [Cryptosporidium ubiquitum]
MLEIISEFFSSCCTLKKNQKNDEYIFILCPAPSDLEEEYIDEEGNLKKKKLEKIRGTARNIVDREIVREWSGREIGSCICCHLIYEDEMIVYRADKYGKKIDGNWEGYDESILQHQNSAKSVGSLSSYGSKKHFSDEPYAANSNFTFSSSDENINTVETKGKKVRGKTKSNISRSHSLVEKEVDEKEKAKNKNKKPIETKDINKDCSTIHSDSNINSNPIDDKATNNVNNNNSINKSDEKCEKQNKSLDSKIINKSSITKHQNPSKLGKIPPLKSELLNTNDQKNKPLKKKIANGPKYTKEEISLKKSEINKISLEKEKGNENDDKNTHTQRNNNNQTNNNIDHHSGSDKETIENTKAIKYEEEEIKFNKDISSKIIRHKASTGIQAEIILKDGSAINCKVSFSDNEDDLSFICDDKVKAVPWSNIKEIFTTKNELKMVNTRAPIFKDQTLIIALHLRDTGNCIPLKFNSKQEKEDFLNFAIKMIRR